MPVRNDSSNKVITKTVALPTPEMPLKPAESLDEGAEDICTLTAEEQAHIDAASATVAPDVSGYIVTDGDVADAVSHLEKLPHKELVATVASLQANGDLDKLVAEADGDERTRLVDLLLTNGLVDGETPTAGVPGPRGPLPPQPPTLAKHSPKLSKEMSAMLRDENVARAKAYREEFRTYRETYQQAVREAKDVKELRAVGRIVEPSLPTWEPGTAHVDTDHEWSHLAARAPDVETGRIFTNKLYTLRGLTPPGADYTVNGSVKATFAGLVSVEASMSASETRDGVKKNTSSAKLTLGNKQLNTELGVEKTKSNNGVDETKVSQKTNVALGPPNVQLKGSAGFDSVTDNKTGRNTVSMNGEIAIDGNDGEIDENKPDKLKEGTGTSGLSMAVSKEGGSLALKTAVASVSMSATTAGAKVEVSGGGAKVGVSVDKDKATATLGAAGVAVTGGVDKNGGVIAGLEGEWAAGDEDNGVTVKLGGTVTVQLPSRKDYEMFIATIEGDFFDSPPELERGVKWSSLAPGVRAAYEQFGWNEKDWNGAAGDKTRIRAAMIGGR